MILNLILAEQLFARWATACEMRSAVLTLRD